jgi:hypothetical protein
LLIVLLWRERAGSIVSYLQLQAASGEEEAKWEVTNPIPGRMRYGSFSTGPRGKKVEKNGGPPRIFLVFRAEAWLDSPHFS